jgi:hypothetical protein
MNDCMPGLKAGAACGVGSSAGIRFNAWRTVRPSAEAQYLARACTSVSPASLFDAATACTAATYSYTASTRTKSEIYDAFEPRLNAGEVELLDDGKLQEQLLTLVIKGGKIDHLSGDHDDFADCGLHCGRPKGQNTSA